MNDTAFAARIRERFPEGLTGLFAIGGTRTAYILDRKRYDDEPGHITDFSDYTEYSLAKYHSLIEMFFGLGGQNMVISVLSFRSYFERGDEYANLATPELEHLIGDVSTEFYQQHDIDPYFVGIDTLLTYPADSAPYVVAQKLQQFQAGRSYQEGHRKLIWEIASIPMYSVWRAFEMAASQERDALKQQIDHADGLQSLHRILYQYAVSKAIGTEIPIPHLYLGTNKSGDLKVRSPLMVALTAGEYLRLYYTPYPSFFITQDTMRTILEDLAFKERLFSNDTDYRGRYTPELAQEEYARVMALQAKPESVLGFSRHIDH